MNIDYEEKVKLYVSDCDLNGTWKLSSMIDTVQTIAHKHLELVGCSERGINECGLTWVLFKTKIEVRCYPKIGDVIRITTFIKKPIMNFIPRYFILMDEKGNIIGTIGSFWAVLDIKTRKTIALDGSFVNLPVYSERKAPINIMSSQSKVITGKSIEFLYMPQFCDFDINNHVHNTVYLDWLCNALGAKLLNEKEVATVTINYNYEICLESVIKNFLLIDNNLFCYSGICDKSLAFEIMGELRNKNM